MKLSRFQEKEKKFLREFVDIRNQQKKPIGYKDTKNLVVDLSQINGGLRRCQTVVWDGLKRFGGMCILAGSNEADRAPARATRKVAGSSVVAKKVLEELVPIVKFMGKPSEYLRPLELLLAEHRSLCERLRLAEEKTVAVKMASKAAKTAVASAKTSAKKIKQLEKDLKILRSFLLPAKKVLRLTCALRQQAMGLTLAVEDLKKKDGVNLHAFLQEMEESELLTNGE